MKAAITRAVTTFAQAVPTMRDTDTALIEALRRENHDLANRATVAECAVQLVAIELGLPASTALPDLLVAIRRLR